MFGYDVDMLYSRARSKGQRGQRWSRLTGRSRRLLALFEVGTTCTVQTRHHAGLRTVQIDQIRGSESRAADFDCDFNPLKGYDEKRWMGVARAQGSGRVLPPVDLIQVGDVYFVRDGHHRISVARALGQKAIEADVTVWQVSGTVPWERIPATPGRAGGARRSHETWRESIRFLGRRLVATIGNLIAG